MELQSEGQCTFCNEYFSQKDLGKHLATHLINFNDSQTTQRIRNTSTENSRLSLIWLDYILVELILSVQQKGFFFYYNITKNDCLVSVIQQL